MQEIAQEKDQIERKRSAASGQQDALRAQIADLKLKIAAIGAEERQLEEAVVKESERLELATKEFELFREMMAKHESAIANIFKDS